MNINPFEMLRPTNRAEVLARARTVGKNAVIQWKDATDNQFHTEHMLRKAEEHEIATTDTLRKIAAMSAHPEDAIFYTEQLCGIYAKSLCRSDEQGHLPRAMWARDNLVTSMGELPEGTTGEHLFKPEQAEVIARYLEAEH